MKPRPIHRCISVRVPQPDPSIGSPPSRVVTGAKQGRATREPDGTVRRRTADHLRRLTPEIGPGSAVVVITAGQVGGTLY